jgi:hypothetical protein
VNTLSLLVKIAGAGIMGVLIAMAGCSKGPPMGVVNGTVTLDGQLLEEGSIQLTAVDGSAPTAGAQIVCGKFETRAAITKYRVQIESNVLRGPGGKKPDPNKKVDKFSDNPGFSVVSLVPAKYNTHTTLELEVKPGLNEPIYKLISK